MSDVAKELRELANQIEQVTHESSVSSIAWEQVRALCDYLCLQARVIEIEHKLDEDGCGMTIGEDLQIMLGLVPIRDRAGIQRGTMATEAQRAAAQSDGNAEGQTLTRQTMVPQAPPMISLPFMGGPGATPEDAPQMAGPGGFGGPKLVPTRGDTKAVVPPVIPGSTGDECGSSSGPEGAGRCC